MIMTKPTWLKGVFDGGKAQQEKTDADFESNQVNAHDQVDLSEVPHTFYTSTPLSPEAEAELRYMASEPVADTFDFNFDN